MIIERHRYQCNPTNKKIYSLFRIIELHNNELWTFIFDIGRFKIYKQSSLNALLNIIFD